MANSGNRGRPGNGGAGDEGQPRVTSSAEQRARERLERQRGGGGRAGGRPAARGRQPQRGGRQQPGGGPAPAYGSAARHQQARASRQAPRARNRGRQRGGLSSTSRTAGIFGGTLVVLAVVIIVLVSTLGGSAKPSVGAGISHYPPKPAPASIVNGLAAVTTSQLQQAGLGGGQVNFVNGTAGSVKALKGQTPLTQGGKPLVLYLGAEYCPFCGATRWALVIALDKFGYFTGLQETASSPVDAFANTPTLTFAKATYHSNYLAFSETEQLGNSCSSTVANPNPPPANVCASLSDYKTIQTPSKFVANVANTYDSAKYWGANAGGIPFIDMGNRYIEDGSPYASSTSTPPASLAGLTWQQVVDSLQAPLSGSPGQAILGLANHYIAAFCQLLSGSKPAICGAPSVKAAAATL